MAKALSTEGTALVIVDKFKATSDVAVQAGKQYFIKIDNSNPYYELVANPVVADIASYYEIDSTGTLGSARVTCIKDYPDIGGTPEAIETTTLCDSMQTYIEGIKSSEQLAFTINFEPHIFARLKEMKGKEFNFGLYFGDLSGKDGKFTFSGTLSVSLGGKGVNEVREATITITPNSEIAFAE